MSVEKYRRYAQECFQRAENVADPGTRIWLFEMAQSWLVLAQQAEKNLAADPVYEAPLSHKEAAASPVMQQQQQVQPKKDPGPKNE
jgi:hypothetical protein